MNVKRVYVMLAALLIAVMAAQGAPSADETLRRAVQNGSVDAVRAAMAHGDLAQRESDGKTLLHFAAQSQSGEKVRLLLEAGVDINARDKDGQTALHYVITSDKRWKPAIEALLEARGIDLNIADGKGRTVLDVASQFKDIAWAQQLLACGAKDSIFAAASRGDRPAAKALLDAGADVNAKDGTAFTPLMLAAKCGRAEMIGDLVARGAKVEETRDMGETALMTAAVAGQMASIDALLANGADMNQASRWGSTFLDSAIAGVFHHGLVATETADVLAQRVLDDSRAKPSLRAAAFSWQAEIARGTAAGNPRGTKDLKAAEALYRLAMAEALQSRAGTDAAMRLASLLKEQSRHADVAAVLIPLIVDDVKKPGLFGGPVVEPTLKPDVRHAACVEIAEAYTKLKRYDDALHYARLARDKYQYDPACGTGLPEYLRTVDERVIRLGRLAKRSPRVDRK